MYFRPFVSLFHSTPTRSRRRLALLAGLFFQAGTFALGVAADPLRVAVAANFAAPMQELARQFEARSGQAVGLSFGSSGKLYAQIAHGAPYDVFLSADQHKVDALIDKGLADPGSRFTYAIGTLVLWAPGQATLADGEALLRAGGFEHLAMANPALAPYGQAAEDFLRNVGLLANTQSKRVLGENISQTFQFVATGNAELGFVALSQLLALPEARRGGYWPIPAELTRPIRQDAALLNRADNKSAARALLAYLRSPEGLAVIARYGYQVDQQP